MPPYLRLGSLPRKRHLAHTHEPGFKGEGIYYEEVVTQAGFSGPYSIVYHLRPPTRVVRIEPAGTLPSELGDEPTLRHHHLKTRSIPRAGDPISGRLALMGNEDVAVSRCRPLKPQEELYRNADADELIFVHHGSGTLRTMFGPLPFRDLDYIVIPRSTTYRLEFDPAPEADLLVIEARGSLTVPARYRNDDGQLKLGAPYSERDLHGPRETGVVDLEEETPILVKDGCRLTRYTMAAHPFDVVGWDGMVYPYTFNAEDFEPITGRVHQPPPVQQTFEAPGFVVCTFAPRMLDTDREAIKVPYAHSNVQADEVLYYVRGRFGSRRGVEESSFTLHPRGIPHGPHPGTIVASRDALWTDELAVMIDTVRPLRLTRAAMIRDDASYPLSWMD
ncbi:MAG TPA: homogentisate 1,2-dioxygenase [Isosphaeraceae bacterium]|nr:homogentisate 1,2-dioxygenase [Isosphaeraceae bacterium]